MFLNNTTASEVTLRLSLPYTVLASVLIGILVLLTVFGNVLVFATFAVTRKLQTFSNYLVLNLAVADFLVGVVSTPFYSLDVLLGGWHLGRVTCMWWMTTDWIACASSSFSLFVISLDRYIHIAFPFWAKRHKNKYMLAVYISLPWTISALAFIPLTVFWEDITGSTLVPERECNVPYYHSYWLLLFNLGITILLPFSMTAILNVMLYIKIRRRLSMYTYTQTNQRHGSLSQPSQQVCGFRANTRWMLAAKKDVMVVKYVSTKSKTNQTVTFITRENHRTSESSYRVGYRRHWANYKKARSLFIFVFVFGMCWIPFVIAVYVRAFCAECRTGEFLKYEIGSTFLVLSNSAFNPLLYAVLRPGFKDGFKRILNSCLCRACNN
jgi:hypothetical protein